MRLVIVDGYNLLRATQRYRGSSDDDLDSARARLISDVGAFVSSADEAVVVFDAAENPVSDGSPHSIAGVTVVFSAFGRDADTVIEEIIARRRPSGDDVLLVTSDQTLQWTTMGPAVTRMSSAEFVRELAEETQDRGEHARDGSSVSLDRRIDLDTRAKLALWARGQAPGANRS